MANDVKNIQTGKPKVTGGIAWATRGAKLPTDATTPLDPSIFTFGGYASEDGLVETSDVSDDKKKAWGGDVVKIVRTEHSLSYKITLIESSNADTLKLVFGEENVTITKPTAQKAGTVTIKKTGQMLQSRPFIFDMFDAPVSRRLVAGEGQPSVSGDVNFTDGDLIAYELTIEAMKDSDGVKAYEYQDFGNATGSGSSSGSGQ